MADLPTPHSIAIGALLSLYSDPNSPLIDCLNSSINRTVANDKVIDDHDDDNEENYEYDGRPQSTAEWTLRLMQLLQQLVLREDEGMVVFHNRNTLFYGGDDNPATDDYDDDDDPNTTNNGSTTTLLLRDPIHVIEDTECTNKYNNNNITLSSKKIDGIPPLLNKHVDVILDDMLLDLFPSGNGNFANLEKNYKSSCCSPSDFLPMSSTSRMSDGDASLFAGQELHLDHIHDSSLNFCMESLSTLLDRIDDAFLHSSSSATTAPSKQLHGRKRGGRGSGQRRKRTPPSQALLERLQMASTSVDDLMNLLDEWHAMMEGTPLPSSASNTTMIVMDGESTFGIYLRKLCLGMEEIPFEALSRLWDALRKFVKEEITLLQRSDEQRRMLKKCDDLATDEHFHHYNNHDLNAWDSTMPVHDWLPSSPQIERIVRRTCLDPNLDELIVKRSQPRSYPPPSRLSSQRLYNLLETHPECPSVHFLMYLSSLANGYRSQALEHLHRYFDYAMIHERKERAERTLMLQAYAVEGGGAVPTTSGGIMGTIASGMGGITGGMTGGIINGRMMHGGPATGQQQRPGGGGTTGSGGGGQAATVKIFKESNVMQYAAILLAQTYYRFGYLRLSLQATEEAIRVAQQSGDEECVCFANAWSAVILSNLGGNGGVDGDGGSGERRRTSVFAIVGGIEGIVGGSVLQNAGNSRYAVPLHASLNSRRRRREEEFLLRRCRARASERGLSLLAANASMELARLLTYRRFRGDEYGAEGVGDFSERGFGCVASSAWDSVHDAGRMSVVDSGGHSSSYAGPGAVRYHPTNIYDMTPTEATSILRQQNMAIAGLWESTGHVSLSALSTLAALYETSGMILDRGNASSALNRVQSSILNGPGLNVWRTKLNGNEESSLDHENFGQAYASILRSVTSLGNAEQLLKSPVASAALHEWSVRSYNLSLAQGMNILLGNRAVFPCPHLAVDCGGAVPSVESALTFLTHSSHLSRQRGQYDKAKAFTRRACWLANQHGLFFHLGSNLLQLSLIELDACSPTSAPERSLPPLLECLELSERYSMDPLRALALSTLSKVVLCLGGANGQRYRKASALLRASLPLVMQHGHAWFQGEAYLTLAKCYLAEATAGESISGEGEKNSKTLKLRKRALFELKRSAKSFQDIEDIQRLRQVYYLQARVYHLLPGSRKERDDASKMFEQLTMVSSDRVRSRAALPT